MDIARSSEKMMLMDHESWTRHSNPWSGWSRLSVLPLLSLAIWSRVWLGWAAIGPVLAVLLWTWINPRLFGPHANMNAWMTTGVLGERILLTRASRTIPRHHVRVVIILHLSAFVGVGILGVGLWQLDQATVIIGLVTVMGCKLWFLDRMVWLHSDMTCANDTSADSTDEIF